MRRPLRTAVLAISASIAAGVVAGSIPAGAVPQSAPDIGKVAVPQQFAQQKIDWEPCFDPDNPQIPDWAKRLECGFLTVPRNWRRPGDGVNLQVAVSRLPAKSGQAKGAIFTNPGGPGAPGRTLPLLWEMAGRDKVLESMDLIGLDPRGTGGSTNITCNNEAIGLSLDYRDRRADSLDLIFDSTRLTAKFCQHGRSADLVGYINTEQTVKDIDLVRSALGYEKINWVGYSGGTWLGAYYAAYFPKRTGQFVLDSVTEIGSWQKTFLNQPLGFERRYREDFLTYAASHDETFQLGATPADVREFIEQLRVDIDEVLGISGWIVDSFIAQNIYSKYAFAPVARELKGLRDYLDNPQQPGARERVESTLGKLEQAKKSPRPRLGPVAYRDAFMSTFTAIICNDTPWAGGEDELIATSRELGRKYPLIGWSTVRSECNFWDRPAVKLPKPTGAGVPPMLLVQSVNDPATPLEGALKTHEQLQGSRMITVTGEGDHGLYVGDNPCVDDAVEAYLLEGVVPEEDFSCTGQPIPPPSARGAAADGTNPLDAVAELNAQFAEALPQASER